MENPSFSFAAQFAARKTHVASVDEKKPRKSLSEEHAHLVISKAGKAEASTTTQRPVEVKGTIIKITEIKKAEKYFVTEMKIEAFWELTVDEVQQCTCKSLEGLGQLSANAPRYTDLLAQKLQADSEQREFKKGSDALWQPGIYLRNLVGSPDAKESWYQVGFKEASDEYFVVAHRMNVTGRFELEFVDEADKYTPLRLCVEVCAKRDTTEVKELSVSSKNRTFKPKNFTLRDKWFLEPPSPRQYPWRADPGWRAERKGDDRLSILGIDIASTDPASSSSKMSYAQLCFYVQVNRSSDAQYYRLNTVVKPNLESPRTVDVRLGVIKVLAINVIAATEPAHTFVADILLETSWSDASFIGQRFADETTGFEDRTEHDKRACELLESLLSNRETSKATERALSFPSLILRNCYKKQDPEEWFKVELIDSKEAKVTRFFRCLGYFIERFELNRFPLDTQELAIELADFNASVDQHQLNERLKEPKAEGMAFALGTMWKDIGTAWPEKGSEIRNAKLTEGLQKLRNDFREQDVLSIVEADYDQLKVTKYLRLESFIKAGDSYFQPDEVDLERNIEQISGRISSNKEQRLKDNKIREVFIDCCSTRFDLSRGNAHDSRHANSTRSPFLLGARRSYVNKEDGFALEGEYVLSMHVFDQMAFTQAKLSGTLKIYPYVKMSLRVRRKWRFYLLQLGLPIFGITFFSFGTLFVQASVTVADRLQVSLSMVATLASYTFVLQQAVPKMSYNTLLDYYLLSSLVLLSLVVVQNVWLGWWSEKHLDDADKTNHEDEERTEWFEKHNKTQLLCRITFIGLWVAWQLVVVWIICRENSRASRFVEHESPEAVAKAQKPIMEADCAEEKDRVGRLRKQSTPTLVRKQSTGELLERDERRNTREQPRYSRLEI